VIVAASTGSQWADMDEACKHCTAGIGMWEWASNDRGGDPDVVMAGRRRCADPRGAPPRSKILREHLRGQDSQ